MVRKRAQAGYALMTILLLAALVLILLSAEVPRILTQGQRAREEELIFRGEQYRRGLGLYFRKYGRFPLKLEELVEPKNKVRFLRQLYPDPMTADGQWRVIRVGPLGELVGSTTRRDRLQLQPGGEGKKAQETAQAGEAASAPGSETLPIIGVVSRSARRAIKVYQGETYYNRWEFIYDPAAEAARQAAGSQPSPPPSTPPQP